MSKSKRAYERRSAVAVTLAASLMLMACNEKKTSAAAPPSETTPAEVASAPAPASTLPNTELGRLEPLAKKVLTFYQNKDVDALVLVAEPLKRDAMKKALKPGEASYESLFGASSWRWKAVEAWDDKIVEVRIKDDLARAQFGVIDGKEAAVVAFKKTDGVWYFEDLKSPTLESFKSWGEPAK